MNKKLLRLSRVLSIQGFERESYLVSILSKIGMPWGDNYLYVDENSEPVKADEDIDISQVDSEVNKKLFTGLSEIKSVFKNTKVTFDAHVIPQSLQMKSDYFIPSVTLGVIDSAGLNLGRLLTLLFKRSTEKNKYFFDIKGRDFLDELGWKLDQERELLNNITSLVNEISDVFLTLSKLDESALLNVLKFCDEIDSFKLPSLELEVERLVETCMQRNNNRTDISDFIYVTHGIWESFDTLKDNCLDKIKFSRLIYNLGKWIIEKVKIDPSKCTVIWGLSGDTQEEGAISFGGGWILHDILHTLENIGISSIDNLSGRLNILSAELEEIIGKEYIDELVGLTPGVNQFDYYATLFALIQVDKNKLSEMLLRSGKSGEEFEAASRSLEVAKTLIEDALNSLGGKIIFSP